MGRPHGELAGDLSDLEARLHYRFRDSSRLEMALTHKSVVSERGRAVAHNERLEFLGDAVLSLAVSHLLMAAYPDFPEGMLSKIRASLVNQKALAVVARRLELGAFLRLGKGERAGKGGEKDSLLSNAYEALLGAIYEDGGFGAAFSVIDTHFREAIAQAASADLFGDYKTALQEAVQNRLRIVPRYETVAEEGPDHAKCFHVEVWIGDKKIAVGTGKSKKEAAQEAAKTALERFSSPHDYPHDYHD